MRPAGRTHTMRNAQLSLTVWEYGATVLDLTVQTATGARSVLLAHQDLAAYAVAGGFLGGTVGRVANRIAQARLRLGEQSHDLDANEGTHHLHGGIGGFHTKSWLLAETGPTYAVLTRLSPDGEEGYPGNLATKVEFRLQGATVEISFRATTDAPTVVNLTNHSYFNLLGCNRSGMSAGVRDHVLQLNASQYTPVDEELIPTGAVEGVPPSLDFTSPQTMSELLGWNAGFVCGLDHNFVLTGSDRQPAATLRAPDGLLAMEVMTDQPALQVFTAQNFDGIGPAQDGTPMTDGCAIALEAQGFPDAPNHPAFPSIELKPGETYHHRTRWRFVQGRATDARQATS